MRRIAFCLEGLGQRMVQCSIQACLFWSACSVLTVVGESENQETSAHDAGLHSDEPRQNGMSGCRVCVGKAPLEAPGALPRILTETSGENDTADVTIDVMFAYSAAASLVGGRDESMRWEIEEALRLTNVAFAASGTGVQFRMVSLGPVDYEDAGDIAVDLDRLTSRHTSAESIWLRREACQADVVCLLIEQDNYWGGAIANRPTERSQLTPNHGHVVMYRADLYPVLLAHELGHLFGCTHDRAAGGTIVIEPYAFGNHLEVEGIPHRTIMAYHPGVEIPLFSGADVFYRDSATGISAGQRGQADNARLIREMAPDLAGYFSPDSLIGFEASELEISESAPPTSIRIVRSGNLDRELTVLIGVKGLGADEGVDFHLQTERVVFTPGDATKAVMLSLIDDQLVEGPELVELSLRVLQRGQKKFRVGPADRIRVTLLDDDSLVRFGATQFHVNEAAKAVRIPVELSLQGHELLESQSSVAVSLNVVSSGAERDRDFRIHDEELVFTRDVDEQDIVVELIEDVDHEATEAFEIRLGGQTVTVSILDNDRPGSRASVDRWRSVVNHDVRAIVPLLDGRIVVGGSFTRIGGQQRFGLARLLPDGSLDDTFEAGELLAGLERNAATFRPMVFEILPLKGGKLLVMGHFTSLGGEGSGFLARLNEDGSMDPSFKLTPGADSWVTDAIEQEDGKVVLVGLFHHFNGQPARGIARINTDGSLDTTFKLDPGPSGWAAFLYGICQQPDGKLIVTGFFEKYHNRTLSNVARLHPDGSVDSTFRTVAGNIGLVLDAAVDPEGGVYIHGFFERFNRRSRSRICRLLNDGTVDLEFNLRPALNGKVEALVIAPDGDLVLGGAFSEVANSRTRHLLKVRRDGSIDSSFQLDRGPDDHVYAVAFKNDHSLLVGGRFQHFDGVSDSYLTQINIDGLEPLLAFVGREENELVVDIRGIPGQMITLEKSTALGLWEPFRSFQLQGSSMQPQIPIARNDRQGFFRLRAESWPVVGGR